MGRQVAYKHTEIIVDACTERSVPLTVIGRGPEHDDLVRRAGPSVTFKTNVSDSQMPEELASAEAFIFAAEEDFGIAPVEAMAAGTPIISYKAGGALDYVKPGVSGEFFDSQTTESLSQVLAAFNPNDYDPKKVASHAQAFDAKTFQKKFTAFISSIS